MRNGGMAWFLNSGTAEQLQNGGMAKWRDFMIMCTFQNTYNNTEYIRDIIHDFMIRILKNCVCGEAPIGLFF